MTCPVKHTVYSNELRGWVIINEVAELQTKYYANLRSKNPLQKITVSHHGSPNWISQMYIKIFSKILFQKSSFQKSSSKNHRFSPWKPKLDFANVY